MFAHRTGWDLTSNAFHQSIESLKAQGMTLLDLTQSNPTAVGFSYPKDLLAVLQDPRVLSYEPSPKGIFCAREAVVSLYAQKGIPLDPGQILLTASTSEAYSFLLRLLCDPGDEIAVPTPSYPLFDYLASLNDVRAVGYPLTYQDRWRIDLGQLARRLTPKTRALVAVHPNNPTGSCLLRREWEEIVEQCRVSGLVLISDEVFAEYLLTPNPEIPLTLLGSSEILTVSLGGLSKFFGLPQMKLAWIAATGPRKQLQEMFSRLEMIADTYLSVNTPVQAALKDWCQAAGPMQHQILERVRSNRTFLGQRMRGEKGTLLAADGGWNAVLHIPGLQDEERWVLTLLREHKVVVHPGYFFDFEIPGFLVLSLLPEEEIFQEGVTRLIQCLPS